MRSVAMCRLSVPASADADAFEQTVLREVLPELAGQEGEGTVTASGLFRRRDEDEERATYLCRVVGDGATGERLEGAGDALRATGADVQDARQFDEVGCVPDAPTVDAREQGLHPLLVCRVHLEEAREREEFERLLLDDVLRADVERGATRTNKFDSFRLHRDESPSRLIDWRYVIEARGSFFFPSLFPGTVERLGEAGARLVECTAYAAVVGD